MFEHFYIGIWDVFCPNLRYIHLICPNLWFEQKYDVLCPILCYIWKCIMSWHMLHLKIKCVLSELMAHTKHVMSELVLHANIWCFHYELIVEVFFFFFFFSFPWDTNEKADVNIVMPAILKCACPFFPFLFHSYLNETKKKSIVDSFNLISYYFHAKSKGKRIWNKSKLKLIWERKNKLTKSSLWNENSTSSSHLWKNPKCQRTGSSNCFNFSSIIGVFMRFSSLTQMLPTSRCWQWRKARLCNVLFDVTSYYRKSLCKMPIALFFSFIFRWNIFHSLRYEHKFLTSRIAGNLMNIKKTKLFQNDVTYDNVICPNLP